MKSVDGLSRRPADYRLPSNYIEDPGLPLRYSYKDHIEYKTRPKRVTELLAKVLMGCFVAGAAFYGADKIPAVADAINNVSAKGMGLETPALSATVVRHYLAATVGVGSFVQEDNGDFRLYNRCTGTYLGNNEVSTAGHCIHDEQGNLLEGSIIATPRDASSFWATSWPTIHEMSTRKVLPGDGEASYPQYYPASEFDVAILKTDKLGTSIPLSDKPPVAGENVYMYSRFGDTGAQIYGGKILNPDNADRDLSVIYELSSPNEPVCIPGTSGGGVLNQSGDLIGVNIADTPPFQINAFNAKLEGISTADIGKEAQVCFVVPSAMLRPLLK